MPACPDGIHVYNPPRLNINFAREAAAVGNPQSFFGCTPMVET